MTKKRAIIFGTGGLCGAYSAGFASELCGKVDSDYFAAVYGISVGTTIASFFVANQPGIIENTWRNQVHGNKLVKPYNFLLGRKILDLNYLTALFNSEVARLDVDKVMEHRERLRYAVIDYDTGEALWINPNRKNIFQLMMAACSVPIVRGAQRIGTRRFFDAGFVYGGIPELERIVKEYDEIVYVSNYPRQYQMTVGWRAFTEIFFPTAAKFGGYPKPLQEVFRGRKQTRERALNYMEQNPKVKLIFLEERIFKTTFDTSRGKINAMVDAGKKDARLFIRDYC